MSNSTITLQTTVNFCSTHGDLLPLSGVGGYTNEPALTLCNDALSDLISDPNDWAFNRVEMAPLFTCSKKQDYLFAGACAFSLGGTSQGWAIDLASNNAITVSGGVVTVNFLEAHRFAVGDTIYLTGVVMSPGTTSKYNSTFSDNGSTSGWTTGWVITATTTTSVSFTATTGQVNSDVGGAPGITNFGYVTSGSLQELNNTSSPPNVLPLTVKRELPVISSIANPEKVCMLADQGTGVLKFRFAPVPGSTIFAANIVYQAKAPLKTSLSNTWAPFPDNFSAAYNQALLYRMYRYLNSPTADNEYKKLQAEIAKVQGADDGAQTDVELQPEDGLMGNNILGWW
jgi:hypothetical protein